jgi:protein ImuA
VLRLAISPADLSSTGSDLPALTALLPRSLSPEGLLMEWLAEGPGTGVETLAFSGWAPRRAWAVIDPERQFYPIAYGLRPLVLRPHSLQDGYWAVEQCLRCPGIGMTWCRIERAPPIVLRRWKLAAEAGGGIGMLFRPLTARREPTWADVRWLVTPKPGSALGRRWQIELLYCRGGFGGAAVTLDLHHATGAVRVVPELADSTAVVRTAGAPESAARAVC